MSLICLFDHLFKERMFRHVHHWRQTARNEDRVIVAYVYVCELLCSLHILPAFSYQERQIVRVGGQIERVEKRRISIKARKIDLVLCTVEFCIRMCHFWQEDASSSLARSDKVSV